MLKASNSNKFKNSTELAASTKEFEQPSNDNNKFKMKTEKKTLYMSFKVRIFVFVIIFLALFTVSLLCATKIIEKTYAVPVTYTEKINEPNYKVYLKENEFYLEPYLPKNQAYVASLIDYIDVDLQYIFTIDDITNIDFEYKVLADLIIESGNGKELGKREYTIVDSKEKSMKNLNEYLITENLKLDYNYYNQLANSFRSLYGVDTVSYLKVYLSIQKKGSGEGYSIDEKNNYNVIMIPLSERVIEISIKSVSNSATNQATPDVTFKVDYVALGIEIIILIFTIVFMIKVIRYLSMLVKRKTPYDKYVNKILREYDRLIVEIHTDMDLSEYNIINVNKFSELLDVRDNLKMPINYYNIIKGQKGIFFIKANNDVYMLTVKNVDIISKELDTK